MRIRSDILPISVTQRPEVSSENQFAVVAFPVGKYGDQLDEGSSIPHELLQEYVGVMPQFVLEEQLAIDAIAEVAGYQRRHRVIVDNVVEPHFMANPRLTKWRVNDNRNTTKIHQHLLAYLQKEKAQIAQATYPIGEEYEPGYVAKKVETRDPLAICSLSLLRVTPTHYKVTNRFPLTPQ